MYLNGTKTCSLLFCCFLSLSVMAKDARIQPSQGLQKPLVFIENKGQVTDGHNIPCSDIHYKLSTAGVNLYLGNGFLHYEFRKITGNSPATLDVSGYGMDVKLLGANPNASVVASDEQAYFENYYHSQNDAGFTAHSWNKVTYRNVYPNIDWVVYVKDNQVEYDFNVLPGGDVRNIKLAYDGATGLNILKDGSLSAETPMGNVTEKKPYAYEARTGKVVASNFVLHDNVVTFETGDYKGTLTIDPYLLWSTYFGGTAEDVATSVRETTGGITFVGGYTASTGVSAGGGIFHTTFGGGTYDAFVSKYTAAGTRTFTTYFGGTGNDQGTAIALDNTGANPNVYLVGYTTSAATGLTTGGAYQGINNGGNDGFLIKFNNNGGRTWCTFFGGASDDFINGVAVDAANNVYVTGQTSSPTLIASAGAYQTTIGGTSDAFVAKFNAFGFLQWSTYFGGTAQENGLAIATDLSNNAIITGQTSSIVGIATPGAYQSTLNGTNDAYVAQFSTAGALVWGTYFGGENTEQGNAVACNPATGDIAVTGNTTSLTGIAGYKAFQPVYGGGVQDAFVAYFTTAGAGAWSSYYGGPTLDYGQGVCFDQFNNVAIAGGTFSSSGIASVGSFQSAIGGDYDAYVAKFNTLGQRFWGTYFGNSFYDYANAIACDLGNDELTFAGYTASTAGIATAGTAQTTNAGGTYDAFVAKFKKDTLLSIDQPYADTLLCAGSTFTLAYTANFNFQPANVFTAQLSDASGSFAAPVAIGSATTNTSGTITCTIPAGTTPGTGYRIQVISSLPAVTSPDDFYDIQIDNVLPHSGPTGSTPVCVGGTIFLNDTAAYAVTSYNWIGPVGSGFGGTGFTAATQTANNTGVAGTGVTLADAGTYSVVVTHNGCPNDTATIAIVVNNSYPPTPSDSGTVYGCSGATIYLFAKSDTTVPGITYQWTGPAGFSSTLQNPSITGATALNAGVYSVTDTMAGCGSVGAGTITVTVNNTTPDSITITASPNYTPHAYGDTICAGTMVTFTATTINGGVSPLFQWMSGPFSPIVGAVSNTWQSASLINGETIFCLLSADIPCPSPVSARSNVITMDVLNSPPLVNIGISAGPSVTYGSPVTFTAYVYSAGAPTYQWYLDGAAVPGATDSTYTISNVTSRDSVSLIVYSTLTCAVPDYAIASKVVYNSNVGVSNIASSLNNIELYPNPAGGAFTVKGELGNGNIGVVSLEVSDILGQVIYSDKVVVANNKLVRAIDLGSVPDGIYQVRITGDGGQSKILRVTMQH